MRSIHLGLYALFTSAVLLVSCAEDELVDDVYNSIPGKKISFNAKVAWQEENNSDSRNASMSLERMLVSEETSISLPMNVSVQEGIHSTSENVPMSRGSVLTKEAIDNFNVWAALNKDAESVGEGTIEYFSGVSYSKDNSGIFSSQTAYYWPGEGPTLDFVAVANMPLENFNANTNNNEVISFTYTVPSTATAQNDIAIATATGIEGDNNTSVPLSFNHIMSAVNFKVGTIAKGVIKSITLNNIYTTGTYHIYGDQSSNNLPYWVVDEDELGPYSVTFAQTDTNGNYNPEGQAGNLINGSNATFMMIPQVLNDNAILTIEFIHDGTTTATTLPVVNLATLKPEGYNGNFEWKMNHTTNYLINVDEDYQINIEPIDAQDAHYVICPISFTMSDVKSSQSVTMRAVANTTSTTSVSWIKFRNQLVGVETPEKGSWWADPSQIYDSNGNQITNNNPYSRNETQSIALESDNSYTYYAFLEENIGESNRTAVIQILIDGDVAKSVSVTQLCPTWTGNKGCERIEEYPLDTNGNIIYSPWGWDYELKSGKKEYKVTYKTPGWENPLGAIIMTIGYYFNQNEKISHSLLSGQYTIDYTDVVNGITQVTNSSSNGLNNTHYIYKYEDADELLSFESLCQWVGASSSSTYTTHTQPNNIAALLALKKNKAKIKIGNQGVTEEHEAEIVTTDANGNVLSNLWYLPAQDETSILVDNDNLYKKDEKGNVTTEKTFASETPMGDGNADTYWTSTSATSPNAVIFTYGGTPSISNADRGTAYKVRAIRQMPTTTGN